MFKYVRHFSKYSTVHGAHILGLQNLHIIERLAWVIAIGIASFYAINLSHSNFMRYLANPTVVSLQKDFRNWENPFPAVTACFLKKIDDGKAKQYIFKKWGVDENSPLFYYYMEFMQIIANISYENLDEFKKFAGDKELEGVDFMDVVVKIHPKLSGTLVTFDPTNPTTWTTVVTEFGVCFSINSKFANLLSPNSNNTQLKRILKCHYLNGLCYARYDSDPQRPLKLYVHSYLDVIHATVEPPLRVMESQELEINFRLQETVASPNLRSLSPSQRKCRFFDEPQHDHLPYYSTNICYITCRYELIMKLCGCKPIFYHYFGGRNCDVNGLMCIAKYAKNLTQSPEQFGCKCPATCDTLNYLAQIPKYTKWEFGYFDQRITFRWGLLHPTTKYRRDILFGLEDLIVSMGGTGSLFLGLSFISLIEIVFLFCENIFMYFSNRKKKSKRTEIIKVASLDQQYQKCYFGKSMH